MAESFQWPTVILSQEDERLADAYKQVGRPLDQLAYSDDFDRLFSLLGLSDSKLNRQAVYTRLLTLRKKGQLP